MKCPYCEYKSDEWDDEKNEYIKGDQGYFYKTTNGIHLMRGEKYINFQEKDIYGCPNCNKIFMN